MKHDTQVDLAIPSLEAMMKAGVHFGHQTSRRHPKMIPFIFTRKGDIHIINLEHTERMLRDALEFVRQLTLNGGTILFVSSKKQARDIVKTAAVSCGMPYIVGRWIGGVFTNFETIGKLISKLKRLEEEEAGGAWQIYKKSEQLKFKKEMIKLADMVGGIRTMTKLPKAIYVVDIKKEKTAVVEAAKKNIPIIAMTDTNVNPELVQYPIPANDDAIGSIKLITECVAATIANAKASMAGGEAGS